MRSKEQGRPGRSLKGRTLQRKRGKVRGEARLKVGKREGVEHCPRRMRKREREGKEKLDEGPEGVVSPYIYLLGPLSWNGPSCNRFADKSPAWMSLSGYRRESIGTVARPRNPYDSVRSLAREPVDHKCRCGKHAEGPHSVIREGPRPTLFAIN